MKKSSARIDSERRIDAALEDNDTKTGRHTLLEILIEQKLRIYIIRIGLGYNTLLKIPTKKMGHKISHNQSIILNPSHFQFLITNMLVANMAVVEGG